MPKATRSRTAPKSKKKPKTTRKTRATKAKLAQTPVVEATVAPSQLPKTSKHSSRFRKGTKPDLPPIAGAFRLFGRSLLILKHNFKLFAGISFVYALLNLLLVHGLASNGDLQNIKSTLNSTFHGSGKQLSSGFTLFAYLLGGSSSTSTSNANAGVYQTLLIILDSLALVWTLRQVYNKQKPRVRDSFYKGVYPLVPFILVLLVIGVQLIPLAIGGFLYATVISNGIAVYTVEKIVWALVFLALALVSLYLVCSSVFALYVATLPDMTPIKALRSARNLVKFRRFKILRKLLFLPIALIIILAAIMLPVILLVTPLAEWVYFILTMAGLAVINSYYYALYRELLPS